MRRIGLIGGMSWESTAVYYSHINREVRARCGGLTSADMVIHSVDFAGIVAHQTAGRWDAAAETLSDVARGLERAGAEALLICTNTMHLLADEIADAVSVPLIHIIDVTASAIRERGLSRPLLLATRYTMEKSFYRERIEAAGLTPLVPDAADRGPLHDIIFDELCRGIVRADSRAVYRDVIARGAAAGADCVILGCTEIGLLIGPEDSALPIFDSTTLHADAAVDFSLGAVRPGAPVTARSASAPLS